MAEDTGVWVKVFPTEEPGPNATGGDEVKDVGGYRYHLFTNSGDFTVSSEGEFEVLVVGGGGAGGQAVNSSNGGGGGAGACTGYESTVLLGMTTYPVVIGAGGGPTNWDARGNSGGETSMAGVAAKGGGGGGAGNAAPPNSDFKNGASGGSGGGGGAGGSGGAANGQRTNSGSNGNGGAGGGAGSSGGAGIALTSIDPNLTAENFPLTFPGITNICAGGQPGQNNSGAQPQPSEYGSGGNGTKAGTPGDQKPGKGANGIVIVRYQA